MRADRDPVIGIPTAPFTLHATRDDAVNNANAIDLAPAADEGERHFLEPARVFDPGAAVDSGANSIDPAAFAGLRTFDTVVYDNGGGTSIGGLVDGAVYRVVVLENGRIALLNSPLIFDVADIDGSVATGTAHRLERVAAVSTDVQSIPFVRFGAAAAVAVSAGRPNGVATIGPGASVDAGGAVTVTALMDYDADAEADADAIGGNIAVGVAAAGNYVAATHVASIGEGAFVEGDSVLVQAVGESGVPYLLHADALSVALGLGGNLAGSVAVNAAANTTRAAIESGAIVGSATTIHVLAGVVEILPGVFADAGTIDSTTRAGEAVIGLVAAAGAAVAGSATLPPFEGLAGDSTEAFVGGLAVVAPDGIEVRAGIDHDFDDQAVSGSLSFLFAAAIAAAFSFTNSAARAIVDGGFVLVEDGALNVVADTTDSYAPHALGLAVGAGIAIAGTLEANIIANTAEAAIRGGFVDADSVTVSASTPRCSAPRRAASRARSASPPASACRRTS